MIEEQLNSWKLYIVFNKIYFDYFKIIITHLNLTREILKCGIV